MYHFSKKRLTFLWLLVFGPLIVLSACRTGKPGPNNDPNPLPLPREVEITLVEEERIVIVDAANLRSGPGVEFESVAILEQGTLIETEGVSKEGDWYLIILPDFQSHVDQGWMLADFLATPTLLATEVASTPKIILTSAKLILGLIYNKIIKNKTIYNYIYIPILLKEDSPPPSLTATLVPIDTPTDTPTGTPPPTATPGATATPSLSTTQLPIGAPTDALTTEPTTSPAPTP